MTSSSPAAAFAVAASCTIAGSALSLGALWMAHRARTNFRRVTCVDKRCSHDRCEMGPTFCPSCGCGPLESQELSRYPVLLNHREAYTCITCMEDARVYW